ncbi:MAG: Fe-S cluster domain-containing protein [Prevotellaceae bacterium]|jgi:Na+-translocating ferredoxin:NAD+ oxidoreductase RNF subunit RnfB|nr:Fe-S cluster domain-containing protein [Prevotellaceae bacterium]
MDSTILTAVIMLGVLAVVLAAVLYIVAQKFKVVEDERIDGTESILPGANCGGCGYTGCRAFAETLVKTDDISGMFCPVGGNAIMTKIAEYLNKTIESKDSETAVVRCAGSCENRQRINEFDGATSCAVMAATYSGDTDCPYGCLGKGDCVSVCNFGAIYINSTTMLPEVDEDKCTACGSCVKACPKLIIELRKKGPKSRRIYVSCINKDKGAVARKACKVACIGCAACRKACTFESIIIENFLAYIDPNKCRLCRKCVEVCPTGSITELNFPPRKPKIEVQEQKQDNVNSETITN